MAGLPDSAELLDRLLSRSGGEGSGAWRRRGRALPVRPERGRETVHVVPVLRGRRRSHTVAETGPAVAEHLARLTRADAQRIGAAARARALAEHTYAQRVRLVEEVLAGRAS